MNQLQSILITITLWNKAAVKSNDSSQVATSKLPFYTFLHGEHVYIIRTCEL